MISNFLKKIFGSRNSRVIKELSGIVDRINSLEGELELKSDSELKSYTEILKEKYKKTQ